MTMAMSWLSILSLVVAVLPVMSKGTGSGGASFFSSNSKLTKAQREKQFDDVFSRESLAYAGNYLARDQPINSSKPSLNMDLINPLQYNVYKRSIVIQLENFSNKLLGDPQANIRCGSKDKKYGRLHEMNEGTKDAFVFMGPKGKVSCGIISWQIMEPFTREKPYRMIGGKGLRLVVTWSLRDASSNLFGTHCKKKNNNEMTVALEEVDLDNDGNWIQETETDSRYHAMRKKYLKDGTIDAEKTMMAYQETQDRQFEVKGSIKSDCRTTLKVQLLGKDEAKLTGLDRVEQFLNDEVWQQMVRQAWLDIVKEVNTKKELYGIGLEPLHMDPLLPEPINIKTSLVSYDVEFWMWNVTVIGLSKIKLSKLVLDRSESLNDLKVNAVLNIGNLSLVGQYKFIGANSWWGNISSEGAQPFSIDMTEAAIGAEITMETINGCNKTNNLVITNIGVPLTYSNIAFDFTNIGDTLNSMIDWVGGFIIDFQKDMIVDIVKKAVEEHMPTMLCEKDKHNVTEVHTRGVSSHKIKETDPEWWELLNNGTQGWGFDTLRRDTLAEKFVTKVFNDKLVKHLSNPDDPLRNTLDPFLLLPTNEKFSTPLASGQIVICEFYLHGLSNLRLKNFELIRNEDLSYSALRLTLSLSDVMMDGEYFMKNLKILGIGKKNKGRMNIALKDVKVILSVALRADPLVNDGNANINIEHFSADFEKQGKMKMDITGTKVDGIGNLFGSKILKKQKGLINNEIKNVLFGIADCIMYKPAQGLESCLDDFWESLGFKVPFTFPTCEDFRNGSNWTAMKPKEKKP